MSQRSQRNRLSGRHRLYGGSPHQTVENLVADLVFIKELNPQMIGIGPFIPHQNTPYKDAEAGTLEETLLLISIL